MKRDGLFKNLACLIIIALALFPCSSQTSTTTGTSIGGQSKPLVFSMLYNDKDTVPLKMDWLILSEIARKRNTSFKIKTGPDANYLPSIEAAMNSPDIPDIILKVWPATMAPYAATGRLLPVNNFEYLMPNYTNYIKTNGLREEVDALRDKNGNYYVLPGFQREIQVQQWIYRRDLFEENKIKEPGSYEELYNALLTLKRLYPDSNPISACYGGAHLFAMMGAGYGIPSGWNGNRMYDLASDSWVFAPKTKNWQEMYRFLRKCYANGLLDPDIFTQDPDTYTKKLTTGKAFVTVTWVSSGFSNWNKQLADTGIKSGFWAPLPVPKSTIGIRALPAVDRFRKGTAVSVNAAAKPYFKDLMGFLDWIYYSEEGRALAVWGKEGITFELKNGKKTYLPTIKTSKNPSGSQDPGRDYGLNIMLDLCEVQDFEDSKKPTEIVEFLNNSLARKETLKPYPSLTLGSAEQDTINLISKNLDTYVTMMVKKFITGETDIDKEWSSYLATLAKMGLNSLEGIWNDAWRAMR